MSDGKSGPERPPLGARRVVACRPRVAAINALEPALEVLTDEELRARTEAFKALLAGGAGPGGRGGRG